MYPHCILTKLPSFCYPETVTAVDANRKFLRFVSGRDRLTDRFDASRFAGRARMFGPRDRTGFRRSVCPLFPSFKLHSQSHSATVADAPGSCHHGSCHHPKPPSPLNARRAVDESTFPEVDHRPSSLPYRTSIRRDLQCTRAEGFSSGRVTHLERSFV